MHSWGQLGPQWPSERAVNARALVTPRWRFSAATPRSRRRTKMSQVRKGPAAGLQMPRRHRRQARTLAAARRLGNKPFRSPPPRSFAPIPTCWPVLIAPVAEARAWVGIGSGRTRWCGGGRLAGRRAGWGRWRPEAGGSGQSREEPRERCDSDGRRPGARWLGRLSRGPGASVSQCPTEAGPVHPSSW
jgi:hypothetical protein